MTCYRVKLKSIEISNDIKLDGQEQDLLANDEKTYILTNNQLENIMWHIVDSERTGTANLLDIYQRQNKSEEHIPNWSLKVTDILKD